MKAVETELKGITDTLYLDAQVKASYFYETLGYKKTSQFHDDEGVPHILMYKKNRMIKSSFKINFISIF